MKQSKVLVAAVIAATLVVGTTSVYAVEEQSSTTAPKPTTQVAQTDTPIDQAELKKRVDERKARLKTRLDATTKQRLATKCTPAQQKLSEFRGRVTKNDQAYLGKYDAFIKRLEKLEAKLDEEGIKSSELLNQVGELKVKYQALVDAIENMKTSVEDAKSVDCKTDPEGFKAALDDARTQAEAVKSARGDLENYIKTTLKPTIQALKEQLNQAKEDQ